MTIKDKSNKKRVIFVLNPEKMLDKRILQILELQKSRFGISSYLKQCVVDAWDTRHIFEADKQIGTQTF